jgi:hypothetical protein
MNVRLGTREKQLPDLLPHREVEAPAETGKLTQQCFGGSLNLPEKPKLFFACSLVLVISSQPEDRLTYMHAGSAVPSRTRSGTRPLSPRPQNWNATQRQWAKNDEDAHRSLS